MKRTAFVMLAVLLMAGCQKKNHAPDTPSVPAGPSTVAKDSLASFSSAANDPDGDSVCIRFDCGDGDTSDWSQYVASGESVSMTYAWNAVAVCSVRAQAKDRSSLTSTWSQPHAAHVGNACFGGQYNDCGYSVQQTTDGGYVIAGLTYSYGAGRSDVWLIKTDANCNKVWDKTFGGKWKDEGHSVQQTSDGGYIIAGETFSDSNELDADVWLIKTDVDGNKVWDRTFVKDSSDAGSSVQQTADGGYIIAGATGSLLEGDVWLIKTDASGNKVWDKTFGKDDFDAGNSVQQTSDGGYIVVGATRPFGGNGGEVWLMKTDANGNRVWDKTFGGSSPAVGNSVQQTSDGGYIVAGTTWSLGAGGGDAWLIKTDADGSKVWDMTFGGPALDEAYAVQQISGGGYVIAGASNGDVWLMKTDVGGSKVWDKTFGGGRGYSVQQTSDGGYVIAGETKSYGSGWYDVWLIKVSGP